MTTLMHELLLGKSSLANQLRLELKAALANHTQAQKREWRVPHNFGLSRPDLAHLGQQRSWGHSTSETIRRLIGLSEISPKARKAARARSRRDHTPTLTPGAVAAYWRLLECLARVHGFVAARRGGLS